jgi:hypothetical protein
VSLSRAKGADAQVAWTREAFEVGDRRLCGAFGLEGLTRFPPVPGRDSTEIPPHLLLEQINETHRRGLDVGGGD